MVYEAYKAWKLNNPSLTKISLWKEIDFNYSKEASSTRQPNPYYIWGEY